MSSQNPYDDEPTYLDLGQWLRIAVTGASVLALALLLYLAATDQGPSLPSSASPNPIIPPDTREPTPPGSPESGDAERATATPTGTPTATPTARATRSALGAQATQTAQSIPEMVQTAACVRRSCNEFYSRDELNAYLAQCPNDYGKFDRDGDSRTCYDADDW